MKRLLGVALAGIIALVAATFVAAHVPTGAEATGNNNPTCDDFGLLKLVKVDPPVDGTYSGVTVDFWGSGIFVNFDSTVGIDGVIVKGGFLGAKFYAYDEAFSGDNLHTPTLQQISHVTFCVDEDPTATPTATATETPTETPTNTPEPTETFTPEPTATDTPEPTSTPTCEEVQNDREGCETATNTPTATPTDDCCDERPTRTPTNTPEPTNTPVPPTATPTGEVPTVVPPTVEPPVLFLPDAGDGTEASDTRAARFFIGGAIFAAAIILGAFFVFRGVSRPD